MRFISLLPSTRKDKKFMITFDNPYQIIHFGSKDSQTYLNHRDKSKRDNYINRHQSLNENWDEVNAASLSRYLLWGDSIHLSSNLIEYFKKFNIDY